MTRLGIAGGDYVDGLEVGDAVLIPRHGDPYTQPHRIDHAANMQRLLGPYKARKMYYTGERVSADELFRRGAIEAVLPAPELMPEALEIARLIATKSPIAIRMAKRSLSRFEDLPLELGYELEQQMTARLGAFDDAAEARAAAAEGRRVSASSAPARGGSTSRRLHHRGG